MPISQTNGNFIDKTFSIIANILLRLILTISIEKRHLPITEMMSAQSEGNYAKALQNYYEAPRLEIDHMIKVIYSIT